LLSQWRAYADDARGFSIGFLPKQMKMPAKKLRVLYDPDVQMQEITGNLRHVYTVEKSKGFTYDNEFGSHLYGVGLDLCAYKHPAFQEEREVRLVHACGFIREYSLRHPGCCLEEPVACGHRLCARIQWTRLSCSLCTLLAA
jgi:hypothetical protein